LYDSDSQKIIKNLNSKRCRRCREHEKRFVRVYDGRLAGLQNHGRHVYGARKVRSSEHQVSPALASIPFHPEAITVQGNPQSQVSSSCDIFKAKHKNFSPQNSFMRATEIGIQQRTMSKFYTKKPICESRQNFQSISINDAMPALLLVPYGALIAITVLVVEKALHLMKVNQKWCLKI
jgi:hypothetical protein